MSRFLHSQESRHKLRSSWLNVSLPLIDARKILPAALIAPTSVPLLYFVGLSISSAHTPGLPVLALLVGIPLSYSVFFVFGLPIIAYLRRREMLSGRNVILSGIIVGLILGLFIQTLIPKTQDQLLTIRSFAIGVPIVWGLVVSATFVLVARQKQN